MIRRFFAWGFDGDKVSIWVNVLASFAWAYCINIYAVRSQWDGAAMCVLFLVANSWQVARKLKVRFGC